MNNKQLLKYQFPCHWDEATSGTNASEIEMLQNAFLNLLNIEKLCLNMLYINYALEDAFNVILVYHNCFVVFKNAFKANNKGWMLPDV